MRRSLEWGEGNKKDRKTHPCHLLHATREHRMAAVDSYLPCHLRESELHNEPKNSLIEKGSSEKKLDWGDLKTKDKLTIASLEWHCWGVEEWQGCGGAASANEVAHRG